MRDFGLMLSASVNQQPTLRVASISHRRWRKFAEAWLMWELDTLYGGPSNVANPAGKSQIHPNPQTKVMGKS